MTLESARALMISSFRSRTENINPWKFLLQLEQKQSKLFVWYFDFICSQDVIKFCCVINKHGKFLLMNAFLFDKVLCFRKKHLHVNQRIAQ